jgi:hypothetical protein
MQSPSMPVKLPRAVVLNTRVLAGIGLLVAAVACFAVLDTTTKRVTAEVPLAAAHCGDNAGIYQPARDAGGRIHGHCHDHTAVGDAAGGAPAG